MKEKKINKGNLIIIAIAVILSIGIIVFAVVKNNGHKNVSNTSGNYDNFAQCLAAKGATMYGASWCPHCQEQKATFGSSFQFIKYVECPDNTDLCIAQGIQGYPTWMIGSTTIEEGFDSNTMKKLSDATGCPLP